MKDNKSNLLKEVLIYFSKLNPLNTNSFGETKCIFHFNISENLF